MPALTNPHDATAVARARAEQGDAWVLYIVVRSDPAPILDELVAATARVMLRAFDRFPVEPATAEAWEAWRRTSFRKVVLRAKGREWEAVATRPDAVHEEPVVALAPRRRSEADRLLRRLQVLGGSSAELPRVGRAADRGPVMLLAADPAVPMSTGKLVAQVAHAVQIAWTAPGELGADDAWRAALGAWAAAAAPVRWLPLEMTPFAVAVDELPCVVVADFGLTEVPSGTRTVLATRPLQGEDLEQALARFG